MFLWFRKYTDNLYFATLLFCCIACIWSTFLTTVGCVLLVIFAIFAGNYKENVLRFFARKSAICFGLIAFGFLLRIAVQLPNESAIAVIVKYIPLAIYVAVIGSQKRLSLQQFHTLSLLYIVSLFLNSIVCILLYAVDDSSNFRDLSHFISHIRLGMFTLVGILMCIYHLFYNPEITIQKREKILLWVMIAWLSCFIIALKSLTCYISLAVIFLYFTIDQLKRNKQGKIIAIYTSVITIFIITSLALIYSEARYFINIDDSDIEKLDTKTPQGNNYVHEVGAQTENGHWVFFYICQSELEQAWQARTKTSVWQKLPNGYCIYHSLIRYMTSKNLRKDATDFVQLTDEDIVAISQGYTNYRFTNNRNPRKRIYESCWELSNYIHGGSPDGHSITQRFEFVKCAVKVISENPFFGSGAETERRMHEMYQTDSVLSPIHWCFPHNQYIFTTVYCGLVGFVIFMCCLVGIIVFAKGTQNFLTIGWFIVLCISFFTEDTLDTLAGMTFAGFIGSTLLFAQPKKRTTD